MLLTSTVTLYMLLTSNLYWKAHDNMETVSLKKEKQ